MVYCNTISNSKLDTFNQCRLKYKRRYIERATLDKDKDVNALRFGSFIHQIFEDGVKAETVKELQTIAESIRGEYPFDSKKYPDSKIDKCIKNFLSFNAGLYKTIGVEVRYEEEIGPDMTVNGIIDRLIKGMDGGYLVIDYKTGKREKTKPNLYNDSQLQGYAYAVCKKYKTTPENVVCAHYYPLSDNFVTIQYSRAQINNYQKMIVDRIWTIRKLKKDQLCAQKNEYCNWCDYQKQCPLFAK